MFNLIEMGYFEAHGYLDYQKERHIRVCTELSRIMLNTYSIKEGHVPETLNQE